MKLLVNLVIDFNNKLKDLYQNVNNKLKKFLVKKVDNLLLNKFLFFLSIPGKALNKHGLHNPCLEMFENQSVTHNTLLRSGVIGSNGS